MALRRLQDSTGFLSIYKIIIYFDFFYCPVSLSQCVRESEWIVRSSGTSPPVSCRLSSSAHGGARQPVKSLGGAAAATATFALWSSLSRAALKSLGKRPSRSRPADWLAGSLRRRRQRLVVVLVMDLSVESLRSVLSSRLPSCQGGRGTAGPRGRCGPERLLLPSAKPWRSPAEALGRAGPRRDGT